MFENRSFSPVEEFKTVSQPVKARIEAFLYRYNRSGEIEIVLRENKFKDDSRPLLQNFAQDLSNHHEKGPKQATMLLENFGVLGSDFKTKKLIEVGFRESGGSIVTIYAAEITDPELFRIEKIMDVLYNSSEEERIRILPLKTLLNEKALTLMRDSEQIQSLRYLNRIGQYLNLGALNHRDKKLS